MKIILFGATGDVGTTTLHEAIKRGHSVTAIARNIDKLADMPGDITRESLDVLTNPARVAALMAEHDIAISALRPVTGSESLLVDLSKILLDAARKTKTPIYLTGGAATLKLADDSGHTVLTAPDFLPDTVRPIAEACAKQDALFDQYDDVQWTCLRPPAMLFQGPLTGQYVRGTDTLVPDHDGMARISFSDFGYAMVDLIEAGNGGQQRLTVGYQNKAAA
ncbi:NAD(P)H-binding protein [Thalassospira sp.]|uniref:NAD(P)-dependent oxidoreductase n=1 Tax=Thalassospira sp. TaxID=1912094 RepID=UPI000C39D430|nr:NAD(P)H-binding protein [Thalassospira sp.]MBC06836.1 potassium transporter TrkA [Thalassospira sp.]|tara:strand:+ start:7219 stop:7881 length:663 start_codon:yes stop_codon:yes gene_type:complete